MPVRCGGWVPCCRRRRRRCRSCSSTSTSRRRVHLSLKLFGNMKPTWTLLGLFFIFLHTWPSSLLHAGNPKAEKKGRSSLSEGMRRRFVRPKSCCTERTTAELPRSESQHDLSLQPHINDAMKNSGRRTSSSSSSSRFEDAAFNVAGNKAQLHANTIQIMALLEDQLKQVKEYPHFIEAVTLFRQHVPSSLQILEEVEENELIQRTFDDSMNGMLPRYFHRFADEMLERHENAMMAFHSGNKRVTQANADETYQFYLTQGLKVLTQFTIDVIEIVRDWKAMVPNGKQELSGFLNPMLYANMRLRTYLYGTIQEILALSVLHPNRKSNELLEACQRLEKLNTKLLVNTPLPFPSAPQHLQLYASEFLGLLTTCRTLSASRRASNA